MNGTADVSFGICPKCGGQSGTGHQCREFSNSAVAVPVNTITPGGPPDPVEMRLQIQNWIACLQTAERMGAMNDVPEGSRYIQISDTLAQAMVIVLAGVVEIIHD